MKSALIVLSFFLIGTILTNCMEEAPASNNPSETPEGTPNQKMTHEQQLEYGKYLVDVMGCHDCHSPKIMTDHGPVPDPNRMLSGHPAEEQLAKIDDPKVLQNYAMCNMGLTGWVGPWGTSFAGNLTPDETGLGNWTIENFERALREGKFKGMENGRTLLPPMPWENLRKLKNDDIAAIWAYLQSIPPVKNVVPAAIPPVS